MNKSRSSEKETAQNAKPPNLGHIVLSTLAAAFGVQNRKNLEKDFKHGSVKTYIIAGLLFTALFVMTLVLIVKIVLGSAGA